MIYKLLYLPPESELVDLAPGRLVCASEQGSGNESIYVEDMGDGGFQQV